MARSDLVLALVQAGAERDDVLFRRTVDAMVADERAKRHNVFADQIAQKAVESRPRPTSVHTLGPKTQELAFETVPRRTLASLFLSNDVKREVVDFVQEHQRVELLRSYGLEPRNRILLTGAPGNGKTSLAEAIAEALALPLYAVRYEGIIASLLGDTARRMTTLVERLALEHCVIFFDEFDAIAKSRGDENETGEIKRLVTSILGHLDRLAPHVIVIAATNYPQLLDRAIWRRFNLHLSLGPPTRSQLLRWIEDLRLSFGSDVKVTSSDMYAALRGSSYSDLEEFRNSVRRRYVLGIPDASLNCIIREVLHSVERRSGKTDKARGTSASHISGSAPDGETEG